MENYENPESTAIMASHQPPSLCDLSQSRRKLQVWIVPRLLIMYAPLQEALIIIFPFPKCISSDVWRSVSQLSRGKYQRFLPCWPFFQSSAFSRHIISAAGHVPVLPSPSSCHNDCPFFGRLLHISKDCSHFLSTSVRFFFFSYERW